LKKAVAENHRIAGFVMRADFGADAAFIWRYENATKLPGAASGERMRHRAAPGDTRPGGFAPGAFYCLLRTFWRPPLMRPFARL
jgi:hypothetical protein